MAKGTLTTIAYGQDDRTKLGEGTLLLVNNTINQSSGTIQLKATFPQREPSAMARGVRRCPADRRSPA